MVQTVPAFVHLAVDLTPVDTQTDRVHVLKGGLVIIVPQVIFAKYVLNYIFI